jgi:hypothetical protein
MARGGTRKTQLEMQAQETVADPITLPVPNKTEEFFVNVDPAGTGNVLVIPSKTKFTWRTSELWYRSVILGPDGRVLSMSLPKFRNLGEDAAETADFTRRIERGEDVDFTEKMDGSLAIRSVVNGRVVWRTRGTWDGGDEYGPAIRAIARQWPVLQDPQFLPTHSLHFEFVHPEFPVVIRYPKPDLILLSAVAHHDLKLVRFDQLEELAHTYDLHLVSMHDLPTKVDELRAAVEAFENCEGIVARYAHQQKYLKLKGAEYLKQHRLRFSFGLRATLDHCFKGDFATVDEFRQSLADQEMDWEIIDTRVPIYEIYAEGRRRLDADVAEAQSFLDAYRSLVLEEHRHERTRAHARLDDRAARKTYSQLADEAYADRAAVKHGCFALIGNDGGAEWKRKLLERHVEQALRESRLPVDEDEA